MNFVVRDTCVVAPEHFCNDSDVFCILGMQLNQTSVPVTIINRLSTVGSVWCV